MAECVGREHGSTPPWALARWFGGTPARTLDVQPTLQDLRAEQVVVAKFRAEQETAAAKTATIPPPKMLANFHRRDKAGNIWSGQLEQPCDFVEVRHHKPC